MTRKLLVLLVVLWSGFAYAANYPISAGAATGTIQASINSAAAASGSNTVTFAAGSYSITAQLTIPCPAGSLVITGPTVPLARYTAGDGYVRMGYTPTAILLPTAALASTNATFSVSACNNPLTIQYLEVNAGHATPNSGTAVYMNENANHVTLQYDYFHGNWADGINGYILLQNLINFAGTEGGPGFTDDTVQWMRFGAQGDCQNVMSGEAYDGGNSETNGGFCNSIGFAGNSTNLLIANNFFYYQEEGMKGYEGACLDGLNGCTTPFSYLYVQNNRQIVYNDFSNIHRIALESQLSPAAVSTIAYNSFHDQYLAGLGTLNGSWMLSVPEWPFGTCGTLQCPSGWGNLVASNVFLSNITSGSIQGGATNPQDLGGPSIEHWGQQYINNFSQGYADCGMQWGFWTSPGNIYYNIMRIYNPNSFTCNEEGTSSFPPGSTQAGNFNTYNFGSNTVAGTLTSQSPTISPNGGSFSGSQVVTLTDPGWTSSTAIPGYATGYGPQGNTSIWYTTDGTTPVPGQGTTQFYAGPFTLSNSGTTVVKAIGMWGAGNQPATHPSGFGFVPSSVISASFSNGGGLPVVATPTFSPGAETFSGSVTVTVSTTTSGAALHCTLDSSTPTASSPLYTAPYTLIASTLIQCLGTESGYGNSLIGSAQYTNALSSVTLTNVGATHAINTGATNQFTAQCNYSDGTTTNCNTKDTQGNAVSAWTSSNPAYVSISSTGVATGVAPGSANITATVGAVTSTPWALTDSTPVASLSSVSLSTTGNIASLVVGGSNQLIAQCNYSDGTTTSCGSADVHGNVVSTWTSSAPSVASISSLGIISAIAAGSTNLTASVIPSAVQTTWGNQGNDSPGRSYPNVIVSTYMLLGSQSGGYLTTNAMCYFQLPAGTSSVPFPAAGSKIDCGMIPAPTATTQGSAWQCYGTYTVTSSTPANTPIGVAMTGGPCGTVAASSAWWIGSISNAAGPYSLGFSSCGGATCSGAAPTSPGTGTYAFCFVTNPVAYGTYTGMPTGMTCPQTGVQTAAYVVLGQPPIVSNVVPLTVTASAPTLTAVAVTCPASSLLVGATTQCSVMCTYSNAAVTNCSVADIYGNATNLWTSDTPTVATVGAVGSANPGLVTAVSVGSANITARAAARNSPPFALTVTSPAVSLTGLSLATTGGVTGIFVGNTNQILAKCLYSDGSNTSCNTVDSHGNVAGSYTSSNTAAATVSSTSGLITAVAPGTTNFTAAVGTFTSPNLPLTILAVPTGIYTITISGPVTFSGTVSF